MPGRFGNIEDYLPPPADAAAPRAPQLPDRPVVAPPPRRRRGRLVEFLSVVAIAAAVLAALSFEPTTPRHARISELSPATSDPSGADRALSLPTGRRQRAPERARKPRPHMRKRTQPAGRRMRFRFAALAPRPVAAPAPPVEPAPAPVRKPRRTHRKTNTDPRVEPPAPPGTPLFHCYSIRRKDHYMTIDPSAVGQLEESRADYDCLVPGNVYARSVRGAVSIRLDEGVTVWLLRDTTTRTKPACTKTALYRHASDTDLWYAKTEVDGGLVGYVCS